MHIINPFPHRQRHNIYDLTEEQLAVLTLPASLPELWAAASSARRHQFAKTSQRKWASWASWA
jgi:hypothetical protein